MIIGLLNLFSQPQNFELKQISEEHGLPGITVRAIFQDSKHILWFGVESAGLCKYDGVTFTLYSNNSKDSSSLGNNFVNTICEATDGYLWIGTDNGLYKFDRNLEKFTPYFFVKNDKNSLCGNQIFSVKININGELWVGTNNGVNIYDKKNNRFIRLPYVENGKELNFQINSICFDNFNNIWLGTLGGLFKVGFTDRKYTRWINIPQQSNSLPNNQIKDICFDKQGVLWIVTSEGCVRFDPKSNEFYELKELSRSAFTSLYGNPVVMMRDSKGFIWIGAEGMAVVNPSNNTYNIYQKSFDDPNGMRSNDIRAIYEDKSGLIWIGTKFEGLQIYNYHKELFPHRKNQINNNHKGLNDKSVMAICEDNNQNLYFGTKAGGLNVFDRKTGIFTYLTHNKNNPASISGNNIYVLLPEHNGNIWMAATNYLEKFNTHTKTFTHYPITGILSLFEDSHGKLWVGRKPGLFIFDIIKHTLTPFHDPNNVFPEKNDLDIHKIYEDSRGNIWIGTYRDGLFEYNPNTKKINYYRNNPKDSTSLSSNMIRSIYEDTKGRLWVGTRLQGLCLLDRSNKKFTKYDMSNGLPSNSIYSILEDNQGNLWLATHNGLSKFNPELKIFKNFNKDDGLQDNIFLSTAYCKSKSGELLFGGNNGFNIFFPEKIEKSVYYAPLVITTIKIFDQTIYHDLTKPVTITLPYNKNYISFGFALLDYNNLIMNQYQYQMENVDKDWIRCGNRHYASYSSLNPGTYTFSVKAANCDGLWNPIPTKLRIIILPPWWKTVAFRAIFLLIIFLLIFVFFYWRVASYRKKEIELNLLIKQRTEELEKKNTELLKERVRIGEQSEELRAHTENLMQSNELLTQKQKLIQLQSDKLQETNRQLSVLNSTKDRFFSIIAHDLRNPFHAVIGFSELLLIDIEKYTADKVKKYLGLIHSSSQKGNDLLENLLQWSRAETGKISFEPVNLNLFAIAENTVNLLEAMAQTKNIQIVQEIEPDIMVQADENMLNTVLRNLISNALKFTNENGKISIKAKVIHPNVEISVSDNGVGIKEENIKLLFRIESNISTKGTLHESGTGLGLILCREFVEKHGGKIWVESTEGKGSEFKFTLPMA